MIELLWLWLKNTDLIEHRTKLFDDIVKSNKKLDLGNQEVFREEDESEQEILEKEKKKMKELLELQAREIETLKTDRDAGASAGALDGLAAVYEKEGKGAAAAAARRQAQVIRGRGGEL